MQVIPSMRLTKPLSFAGLTEVDPVQQSAELELGETHRDTARSGPGKGPALEPLRVDAEPGAIPVKNFASPVVDVGQFEPRSSRIRKWRPFSADPVMQSNSPRCPRSSVALGVGRARLAHGPTPRATVRRGPTAAQEPEAEGVAPSRSQRACSAWAHRDQHQLQESQNFEAGRGADCKRRRAHRESRELESPPRQSQRAR